VNEVVASQLGFERQLINYNPELERFTINLEGAKVVLQGVSNH
jgi:hypothetical protein